MINKYEKLLLNIESNESKITSFTSFGNFDPSYLWTNEDMKLSGLNKEEKLKINRFYKKVLEWF